MTIIFNNCIVNTEVYGLIYTTEEGLCFGTLEGAHVIRKVPADALQQVALAKAKGTPFIEMEGEVELDDEQ